MPIFKKFWSFATHFRDVLSDLRFPLQVSFFQTFIVSMREEKAGEIHPQDAFKSFDCVRITVVDI